MTEFQQRVASYVEAHPGGVGGWEIAQEAFPEKWKRRQGRGALVGHIDNAAHKLGLIRILVNGYPVYFPDRKL